MGKSERSSAETQAHNINGRKTENRGGSKGTLGEAEGGEEEVKFESERQPETCRNACLSDFGFRWARSWDDANAHSQEPTTVHKTH
jgi:hypothetical protein